MKASLASIPSNRRELTSSVKAFRPRPTKQAATSADGYWDGGGADLKAPIESRTTRIAIQPSHATLLVFGAICCKADRGDMLRNAKLSTPGHEASACELGCAEIHCRIYKYYENSVFLSQAEGDLRHAWLLFNSSLATYVVFEVGTGCIAVEAVRVDAFEEDSADQEQLHSTAHGTSRDLNIFDYLPVARAAPGETFRTEIRYRIIISSSR